jgi:hypothetical protein
MAFLTRTTVSRPSLFLSFRLLPVSFARICTPSSVESSTSTRSEPLLMSSSLPSLLLTPRGRQTDDGVPMKHARKKRPVLYLAHRLDRYA